MMESDSKNQVKLWNFPHPSHVYDNTLRFTATGNLCLPVLRVTSPEAMTVWPQHLMGHVELGVSSPKYMPSHVRSTVMSTTGLCQLFTNYTNIYTIYNTMDDFIYKKAALYQCPLFEDAMHF